MKLAFSIAATWTLFDLFAGKVLLSGIGPMVSSLWQSVAHALVQG